MCKSEIFQEFFVKQETGQTTQNRLRTKPTSLLHFDQTAWNPLQCVESFIPRVCIVSHSNANAKRPSHCLMLGCWMASIEKQRANGIERDSERNRKVGAWDKVYRPQTLLVINRFSPALHFWFERTFMVSSKRISWLTTHRHKTTAMTTTIKPKQLTPMVAMIAKS